MAPSAVGVSLWLTPEGVAQERLAALIRDFARRFGTPAFAPHVTLLGGLQLPEERLLPRARELARVLRPFPIHLTALEGTDEYFRCFFARVEATRPLLAAHARARAVFAWAEAPFQPHLSLLYGALPPETRLELRAQIECDPTWSFDARQLELVRTQGPPADWRSLGAFALGA